MPTLARTGPYRFFIYSNETEEPPHVHVQRERFLAKFWLNPVSIASPGRFAAHELNAIQRLIEARRDLLLEAWHEHLGR
ncbi:MAG: DUF4160 domain-containing protein [Gammaproteobacteria bacterium]|nr:MAG: DUF4160 domain-containing protein [Gammaproteobacteria bacterium]